MTTVYEILEELSSSNSGNFKLEVLEKYQYNEDLKTFFVLTLDKSINYYIKKIPKYSTKHTGEVSLKKAMWMIRKLSMRILTGNMAKVFLSKLLTSCTSQDAEVICRIIKRDANCKVSYAKVNKIWPDLIKLQPCMLCERSTRKNLDHINYPAFIQEKSDGLRFYMIHKNGEVTYDSRNGKRIELHNALDDQVKYMAKHIPYDDFVIDGEGLIIKFLHQNLPSSGWKDVPELELFESRQTGNGIFNKGIKHTISKEEANGVRVKVWDIIPYDEFYGGKGTTTYKDRITFLNRVLKFHPKEITKIGLSLTKIVKSEEQALKFYKKMLNMGKEGAILKNMDSLWEDKRSKEQVKLKVKKQLEMKVVGTYPHKKKKGWIGGLTLESSDGIVKVDCGSGLKDKDRKRDPIYFMNKIIMIESNGLTKDEKRKDDSWSLFLPIYKEIRIDKDEADSYEKIVEEFNSI